MNFIFLILFLLGPVSYASVKIDNQKLQTLNLIDKDTTKKSVKSILSKNKLLVIVNIATGCPMVKKSYPKYEKLYQAWRNKEVHFIYLDSSPNYKINESLAELAKYQTNLNIYFDQDQIFTHELGFESTNQIIIVDTAKGEIIYKGAIDSSLNYYTQKTTSENYAENALINFFSRKKISPESSEAFGCAITFKKI